MELTFNTPALLFPAISLLLLAFTNRFVALASLVRKLHSDYQKGQDSNANLQQIRSLRQRIRLIKYMQGLGVFSFVLCTVTMYCIYNGWTSLAKGVFAFSLLSFLSSLLISLMEIIKSTQALELELSDIEEEEKKTIFGDLWGKKMG
ncbi:DUF2721 domain-containing protein [Paraflavisolibacter sp. H34]|uniref:DUF2721 domain-containing protein n=1 Tax=Huijunlia imazamoxiresistens TaxID=3127457 RepID=UPI003015CBCA